MKKRFLLTTIALPVLTISPLFCSCQKPTEPAEDYCVTKEEFEKAIDFSDVKFVQVESNRTSDGSSSTEKNQFSPTVFHGIKRTNITSQPESYFEIFTTKNGEGEEATYTKFERESEDGNWGPGEKAEKEDFKTPDGMSSDIIAIYQMCGGYENFSFDPSKKSYVFISSDYGETIIFEYGFFQKKFVKLKT